MRVCHPAVPCECVTLLYRALCSSGTHGAPRPAPAVDLLSLQPVPVGGLPPGRGASRQVGADVVRHTDVLSQERRETRRRRHTASPAAPRPPEDLRQGRREVWHDRIAWLVLALVWMRVSCRLIPPCWLDEVMSCDAGRDVTALLRESRRLCQC